MRHRNRPSILASLLILSGSMLAPGHGLAAGGAEGKKGHPVFPVPPRVDKLDNGLTVISIPWDSPGIIAYYTLVRVGSRDEVEAGHTGFAHLFEHMMFRGTERYPEKKYEETIQGFGADNNAFTTQDFTMYTVTAPSTVLPELVEIEADRFQHLKYDETQFRTETGAVLGEYNKSASNPFLKMWEALSESAFKKHTYGHTTLGYLADIKAMPDELEYSLKFFKRFYTPDNTTVLVAGDVDHDKLLRLVKKEYGGWKGRRHRSRIPKEPPPRAAGTRHLEWDGPSPPRLFLGYRTPAFDSGSKNKKRRDASLQETAALQVVHGLAFDASAPLYQTLVVEEQKVLELSSWEGWFKRDPHLFVVNATLKPETGFEPIVDAVQAELTRIAEGGTKAGRIDAVKSHVRYSLLTELDTPDDVANLVGEFIAVGGDLSSLDEYLKALEAVTAEDVARVAKRYLVPDRRFVVTLAPKKGASDE